MNAFWYWLQVVVAGICVVLSGWAWAGTIASFESWVTTFPQVITALFFMIGVALSLFVNILILGWRKPPRVTTVPERALIGIVIGLLTLTVVLGLFDELSWAAFITWPLIVLAAIASTVLIIVGNSRASKPAPPVPWETPSATPPTAA